MPEYKLITTMIAVCQDGDNTSFGETITKVRIDDHGAGPFIVLDQPEADVELRFDFEEFDAIVKAVRRLKKGLR